MKIRKVIEPIIGPISEEMIVSLFIVAKNDPRLKKLDLDPTLSAKDRAAKLRKWGQQDRFVAVIELGDQMFAHTHSKFADVLNQRNLSIGGKKVSVKSLSDEDSKKLSVVGEAFGEYLEKVEDKVEKEEVKKGNHLMPRQQMLRQYFAPRDLVSDQMKMAVIISRLSNIPGQVILECLRRLSEDRREQQKINEEEDKYFKTLKEEIKRNIMRTEANKEQIYHQINQSTLVKEDIDKSI